MIAKYDAQGKKLSKQVSPASLAVPPNVIVVCGWYLTVNPSLLVRGSNPH